MHTVLETDTFKREADRLLTEDERMKITAAISENPQIATIPGSGGARKVRFGTSAKGKSGGYRVVTYYAADDVPGVSPGPVCERREDQFDEGGT